MEKKFKPFDKVLVRSLTNPKWSCDFYSHFNVEENAHDTVCFRIIKDKNILPYEGNEHLVGTTDEPEEEVRLEEEEALLCTNKNGLGLIDEGLDVFCLRRYKSIYATMFNGEWPYAIRFKDFDPSNMEETKKHILCVRNGKVVKYKV